MLLNTYNSDSLMLNFPELDSKIAKYYDLIVDDISEATFAMTPRYRYENGLKIGLRDIFYYINMLYDHSPKSVIDIGCGENIWKKWFPNIIGFDPNPSAYASPDFIASLNEDFSKHHYEEWECGIALNSIHFVSWHDIGNQIKLAMNLIKDRLLVTVNFNMLDSFTQDTAITTLSRLDKIELFTDILHKLGYTIIMLDYPSLRASDKTQYLEYDRISGSVRVILAK